MILAISNLKPITSIKSSIIKIKNRTSPFIEYPDTFEKRLEYINDVVIKRKLSIFNMKKVSAKVYKQNALEDNTERYILTIDGKRKLGDIDIKEEFNSVFVSNLESYARKKYKGIGSKLMQIAVEKSLLSSPHKPVNLNAQKLHFFQRNPRNFYKKLGFEEVFYINKNDMSLYGNEMYLYSSLDQKWLTKIRNNAILKGKS